MNEYANLNRAGQIRRIRSEVMSTYRECGMAVRSCRILEHQHNTTFRVELETGELNFVRVSRIGDRPESMILPEIEWIKALSEDGLPVAKPMEWRTGSPWKVIDRPESGEGRIMTRFDWKFGKALAKPSCEQWRTIGRIMAELHNHSEGKDFGKGRWDVDAAVGNTGTSEEALRLAEECLGTESRQVLERVAQKYEEIRPVLGSVQLIHGDIHCWNILFDGQLPTVIDFDDCGFAPLIYDLCVPIRELRKEKLPGSENSLLEGYQSVRKLPESFIDLLPLVLQLRAVQLIHFVVGERSNPGFAPWWEDWCRKEIAGLSVQA